MYEQKIDNLWKQKLNLHYNDFSKEKQAEASQHKKCARRTVEKWSLMLSLRLKGSFHLLWSLQDHFHLFWIDFTNV